jgi:hypothetical protein
MVGLLSLVLVSKPLVWAPSPVDNPLKGLVPYSWAAKENRFPHSMEFDYFPLSALVTGPGKYDWTTLDGALRDAARRGNQFVFRVFLETPGRPDGIPEFLVRQGLKTTRWQSNDAKPIVSVSPDYRDSRLRKVLTDFIAALGKRYDRDPRVAYITAGLLGSWGEWHTWPRTDLYAPKEVEAEVMAAYQKAFRNVPVLLRYPAAKSEDHAPNAHLPFGYHDDSFAHSTLKTSRPEDGWFYMALLEKAGRSAMDKWKSRPIGGEIRPEVWGRIFDPKPGPDTQDFRRCVDATHATWLMDTGMFQDPASPERRRKAETEVRHMGYDFHAVSAEVQGRILRLAISNNGVAPFYRPWPAELGLIRGGKVVATIRAAVRIDTIMPKSSALWRERLTFRSPKGRYMLGLRVANPMPGGRPIGFANADWELDAKGWLSLGTIDW